MRAGRAYIARRVLYILRRDKMRYATPHTVVLVVFVDGSLPQGMTNARTFTFFIAPIYIYQGILSLINKGCD